MTDWHDLWEQHAEADRRQQDGLPVAELLQRIRAGRFGPDYTIWYSVADRATLDEAGWILFDVVNSRRDYLYRYHAAEALLSIMRSNASSTAQWDAIDLTADRPNQKNRIHALRRELEDRIGPPPRRPGWRSWRR